MDRPPVHELSAVNGRSLRIKGSDVQFVHEFKPAAKLPVHELSEIGKNLGVRRRYPRYRMIPGISIQSPVHNRCFHVKQLLGSGSAPSHLVFLAHAPVDQFALRSLKFLETEVASNSPSSQFAVVAAL
jgi:hypothetical protein